MSGVFFLEGITNVLPKMFFVQEKNKSWLMDRIWLYIPCRNLQCTDCSQSPVSFHGQHWCSNFKLLHTSPPLSSFDTLGRSAASYQSKIRAKKERSVWFLAQKWGITWCLESYLIIFLQYSKHVEKCYRTIVNIRTQYSTKWNVCFR